RRGITWLITPATTPARFASALASGTDVAVLDLEDSVPHRQKEQARDTVLNFLTETEPVVGGEDRAVLGVRVNALATLHGLRDLTAIAESGVCPAVLLIPKVETPRDIDLVAELFEASGNAGESHPEVWALIETPQAIQQLPQITSSPALTGVVFGAADYAAAAGCRRTASALRYPRAAL
ncbi:HpcH/HpaI aldolase/citrate lyase family protein, partial [Actinomadura adrarensis]